MQGKAAFRGHPLHLITVSFPVAFWTGTLLTDGLSALTHDPFWPRMSVALVAMGLVGGVVSALPGWIDYRTVPLTPRAASLARAHLWWSLAELAIFALALALRRHDPAAPLGVAVTLLGTLILLVGAYLGSELATKYGLGTREREPG